MHSVLSRAPLQNCCTGLTSNFFPSSFSQLQRQRRRHRSSLSFKPILHSRIFLTCVYREDTQTVEQIDHDPKHICSGSSPLLSSSTSAIQVDEDRCRRTRQKGGVREEKGNPSSTGRTIASKEGMRWGDLRAALGQRINSGGIVSSVRVIVNEQRLALPNVRVPDIRYIDWEELHRRGFKGIVFDKDNTVTEPYSMTLWSPLEPSIEQCKSFFGANIAVFSNSAGLWQYDPEGRKAAILETAIGLRVIRHKTKKPAGTSEEIEKLFGCKSSELVMIGDRALTDVVYGNRNGFLTILTEPFSTSNEPFIVRQVRKVEASLLNNWFRRGLKPTPHALLPDTLQCIKESPLS